MFLFLLGFIGGLGAIANNEVRTLEHRAAHHIAQRLTGDHKRVAVRTKLSPNSIGGDIPEVTIRASRFQTDGLPIFSAPGASERGRLRSLKIDLRDFDLCGLHVQHLTSHIAESRFDMGKARHGEIVLSRSGTGDGTVQISHRDLERFILTKYKDIRTVKISVSQDRIIVDGIGVVLFLAAPFRIEGRMASPDGRKIVLTDAQISFNGKQADTKAQEAIMQLINPLLDLDVDLHLYGAMDVKSIKLDHDTIEASGVTRIPAMPIIRIPY